MLGSIVTISLLVFVCNPTLQRVEIWPYILTHIPYVYKGCLVICILGMAISTADSILHTATIMACHDLVKPIRDVEAVLDVKQLRLVRLTTLVIGLLAMTLTVYYPGIFQLNIFVFGYALPFFIVTVVPPFILAVFGFRGSSLTALIGMTTGILVALVFEKCVEHKVANFYESFGVMANGIAMMVAHYLLPQPPGKGWVEKDHKLRRIEQLIRVFKIHKKKIDLE
ncbi:sodium:solute symporter family transporter [Cardinium endosymbiont of Dermatophagoides farinae]|uniref:sodium:solute symporter family transporter n=1 Tax=Cardinium endosymbiont of Dermatophagoides farinae TaxID=2597823 RepID=UPI0016433CF7|nr:hypothetical protein [Cardinium endosymbiont of Dermatophagoides farinae]